MKIILKITFAVIFFIIETSGFLPAQKTQLNTNLKSDTYSVGFLVVNATDFSRVYKTKNPNMTIDKYSNGKPIGEEELIEQAFIFFTESNKPSLGINTLKLNIIEYPESFRSYGYLGRLFEKKKD